MGTGDGDTCDRDYIAIPEQDIYEVDGLDDEAEVEEMGVAERRAAEALMRKRDIERARITGRLPAALLMGGDAEEEDDPVAFVPRMAGHIPLNMILSGPAPVPISLY